MESRESRLVLGGVITLVMICGTRNSLSLKDQMETQVTLVGRYCEHLDRSSYIQGRECMVCDGEGRLGPKTLASSMVLYK